MAPIFKLVTLLSFSLYVAGQGTQFITGTCASDAECASTCCGFTSGKCAAPLVATERGEGCGFGDAEANRKDSAGGANAAAAGAPAASAASAAPVPAGGAASGAAGGAAGGAAAPGTQFITGPCQKDADCASACCGFQSGKCAGPVIAQTRDGGCGFGDAQPNDVAAQAFRKKNPGRRGPALM